MNILPDIDPAVMLTLVAFFAVAIIGPIWVVRVIVRAERRATKRDIDDAFKGITQRMYNSGNAPERGNR